MCCLMKRRFLLDVLSYKEKKYITFSRHTEFDNLPEILTLTEIIFKSLVKESKLTYKPHLVETVRTYIYEQKTFRN